MKNLFFLLLALPFAVVAGNVSVTSVTAQQRSSSNGLVDIVVTIQGVAEDMPDAECSFAATNGATKAAIPVEHITRNGDDEESDGGLVRRFIWDVKADIGEVKIDDVELTVDAFVGVQLWEKGPYWAKCNIGASLPEACGYYFWWGDTIGYKRNANNNGWISVEDSSSFSFVSENSPTYEKENSQLRIAGYIDGTGNLVAKYDAATAHLGEHWRMPTDEELGGLSRNCTTKWTTRNGVYGRLITGKGVCASRSIFLPAAGCGFGSNLDGIGSYGEYWSSSPNFNDSNLASDLYFNSSYFYLGSCYGGRYDGFPVRPVRGFADSGITADAVTTHLAIDCTAGRVEVTSVTAQQRYSADGLVDIVVTIQGVAEDMPDAECSFAATNGATKAAIPVEHITRNGDDVESDGGWIRKFIWDVKADVGAVKIDDVELTVDVKPLGGVQLWEDGPYWAECNVGASKPEDIGYFFWWGDTVGYIHDGSKWNAVDGSATDFRFSYSNEKIVTLGKGVTWLEDNGYVDYNGNLTAAHDAARKHCGAPWRIPTEAEHSALISNCTTTWTTRNAVYGCLVTGKGTYASNSIFFPVTGNGYNSSIGGSYGYLWSSAPDLDNSDCAWLIGFGSNNFDQYSFCRYNGFSVRPVRGFADSGITADAVTTHLAIDCTAGRVEVTSVTAQQRYPWNGLVDVVVMIQGRAENVSDVECLFVATNSATGAAISVEHITRNGDDVESTSGWTRKFVWDARADVGTVKIDDVTLTVDLNPLGGGVQLWENGPYWAACNVGASKPEECGSYFGCPINWGEWYFDEKGNLIVGAPWRIPTDAEFAALVNNCDTEWTSRNGVSGRLVKGRGAYAAKSIFLPAAGEIYSGGVMGFGFSGSYWSSTQSYIDPPSGIGILIYTLGFSSDHFGGGLYNVAGNEFSLRLLREFARPSVVTTVFALDCREGWREIFADGAELRYDASWCEDGCHVRITDNGELIETGSAGTKLWVPVDSECHHLQMTVVNGGGTQVGNEDAYFVSAAADGDIVIPNGWTELSANMFKNCDWLKSVTIPSSVTSIGDEAFYGCDGLTRVIFKGETPPNASDDVFAGAPSDLKVCVQMPSSGWGEALVEGEWRGREVVVLIPPDYDVAQLPRLKKQGFFFAGWMWADGRPVTDGHVRVEDEEVVSHWISDESMSLSADDVVMSGGDAFWKDVVVSGVSAVASGKIGDSQESWLEVEIPGPVRVSFDWRVSCEESMRDENDEEIFFDGLEFLVDGKTVGTIAGERGWTTVPLDLTEAGPHVLRWRYFKDESDFDGDDGGVIANLVVTPYATVTFAAGGNATGDPPEGVTCLVGTSVRLPAASSLAWAKHRFVGWSDGEAVYQLGDEYEVALVKMVFTAVWEEKQLAAPVIDAPEYFEAESTQVVLDAEDGAEIRYTLDGTAPNASSALYERPFAVGETVTIKAIALRDDWFDSAVAERKIVRGPWTFGEYLEMPKQMFSTSGYAEWVRAKGEGEEGEGSYVLRSGTIGDSQESVLSMKVQGAGTVSFKYRVSSQAKKGVISDGLAVRLDGSGEKVFKDGGDTGWKEAEVSVSGAGEHTVAWVYYKNGDGVSEGEDCAWLDWVKWTPPGPSVVNDPGAVVTGDAETGYVVVPSADLEQVEINLNGIDPSKVTVEVSVGTKTVAAKGAKVKVVSGGADITEFLNVPAADGNGVIDLTKATVKEEIVKEAMDPTKGAVIELNAANPKLTTPNTRIGLFYTFSEGRTLGGMERSASKTGDGEPFSPEIKVKGGNSAFYSIGVGKGE